jgi:hypothetical protein
MFTDSFSARIVNCTQPLLFHSFNIMHNISVQPLIPSEKHPVYKESHLIPKATDEKIK